MIWGHPHFRNENPHVETANIKYLQTTRQVTSAVVLLLWLWLWLWPWPPHIVAFKAAPSRRSDLQKKRKKVPYCALLRPTSLRIFNFETSTLAATDVHSHWQHSQHQTMAGICAVRIIAIFCVTVAMAMAGIRAAGITAIICMAMAMAGITGMAVTMTMFLATK